VEEPARKGRGTPNFYYGKDNMTLLPPGSYTTRVATTLLNEMPREGEFVYLGSCMDLGDLTPMIDSDEWPDHRASPEPFISEIREKCAGMDLWEKVLGYAEDTVLLENDWHVDYGKGKYKNLDCYWVQHSRIEYVWVNKSQLDGVVNALATGVQTGRMSSSSPNLSNHPKCKHGNTGPCMDCRMDPVEMKVIPYAIDAAELEKWGCPYCGYAKGHMGVNTKTGMPAAAAGTFVRYCNSCRKFAYALAPGAERSTIPFGGQEEGTTAFYPRKGAHPRHGVRPHLDKMEQGEGESSEGSEQGVDGSEQRLKP
jgi:hypothetical protein